MDYKLGELVHIFATDKCNQNCKPCFREFFSSDKPRDLVKVAKILTENKVKKAIIGGGEPTLIKNLNKVLRIFRDADIPVDLHTNGTTLSYKRLEQLEDLVDVLGLPIDSLDSRIQSRIRAPGHLKQIKKVIQNAQKFDYKLEYHTVATAINVDGVPKLYSGFIKNTDYQLWNIYQFNVNLAMLSTFQGKYSEEQKIKRIKEIQELRGPINHEKGLSDGLLAKFLLMEEKIKNKYSNDDRIQFVDLQNSRSPYFFVNSTGDVEFYTWFSQKRTKVADLFEDDFKDVIKKLHKANKMSWRFDQEDFVEAITNLPIFARLYEGNYSSDEIEIIKPQCHRKVKHLANLWEIKRYGQPMTV